ncbi:MAG TPA: hypothetical protein VM487_15650 [Phycisphaerae bacterium]|nr:hypothetical protein [Phycisphaerae bacterium]
MNPIYQTAESVIAVLNRMLETKLKAGEPVTHQFRGFCEDEGISIADGIHHPHRPWPFALRDPLVCRECGWIERADELYSAENFTKTFSGGIGPESEPDEWALMCPDCGALDSYEPQPVCDSCSEYPCICEADEEPTHV